MKTLPPRDDPGRTERIQGLAKLLENYEEEKRRRQEMEDMGGICRVEL